MRLKVLTPERTVIDEDVAEVVAMATDGSFGVRDKHIPMVTPLQIGVLSYTRQNQTMSAVVMGGLFSTDGESATVLTEAAELGQEIDFLRAESAKKRAEARLAQQTEAVDVHRAEMALARAFTRLKLQK